MSKLNKHRVITLNLTSTEAAQLYHTVSALDNEEREEVEALLSSVVNKLRHALFDQEKGNAGEGHEK